MQDSEKLSREELKEVAVSTLEKRLQNLPNFDKKAEVESWFTVVLGGITMVGKDEFGTNLDWSS